MIDRICPLFLLILLFPRPVDAYDEFSDERAPARFSIVDDEGLKLILKGQSELSWRDIEGQGGDGYDSTSDTVTLGTRSGHADIDGLRLAFRLESPENLAFYSAFLFDGRGARAEGAWLDHRVTMGRGYQLHTEMGLHTPMVAVDHDTSRAPLASRIYWGQPEMHLSTKVLGEHSALRWWWGFSVAAMRPLDAELLNDASKPKGTLAILSYGAAEVFSGNQPVWGTTLGAALGPVQLEGFAYKGELSAARGTDELRNRLANFALLPGFNSSDPRDQDSTFWWAGARIDVQFAGFEARVEWIESRESLLKRGTVYGQVGYAYTRGSSEIWLRKTALRLRLERYQIHGGGDALNGSTSLRVVDPSQALSWDYKVATASLCTVLYRDLVRIYLEHSLIAENNGSKALGIANAAIRNNETTLQLELRF